MTHNPADPTKPHREFDVPDTVEPDKQKAPPSPVTHSEDQHRIKTPDAIPLSRANDQSTDDIPDTIKEDMGG